MRAILNHPSGTAEFDLDISRGAPPVLIYAGDVFVVHHPITLFGPGNRREIIGFVYRAVTPVTLDARDRIASSSERATK